eukprot:g520.t1
MHRHVSADGMGGSFKYIIPHDHMHTIETFCDADNDIDTSSMRMPLLIAGPDGCGKSALLANWTKHRRHRNAIVSGAAKDELVLYHNAGCSVASTSIKIFLHRACTKMNAFFALKQKIPDSESKLSWLFSRMIESISDKGRLIIVIDGVHLLKGETPGFQLHWLPNRAPRNVYFILSVSTGDTSDSLASLRNSGTFLTEDDRAKEIPKLSRLLVDLVERRGCTVLELTTSNVLKSKEDRLQFLFHIFRKTSKRSSGTLWHPHHRTRDAATATGHSAEGEMILFESQIRYIERATRNRPIAYMHSAALLVWFLCDRGFDAWSFLNKDTGILSSDVVSSNTDEEADQHGHHHPIVKVMQILKEGFSPTSSGSDTARNLARKNGGIKSLQRIFKTASASGAKKEGESDVKESAKETTEADDDVDEKYSEDEFCDDDDNDDDYSDDDHVNEAHESDSASEVSLENLPAHLLGGIKVPALSDATSHAIALLRHAHFGLTALELKALVDSISGIAHSASSIASVVLLLRCGAVGSIHVENLFAMPSGYMRHTIDRALQISETERRKKANHAIASYFLEIPIGQRRAEELPRALLECKNWSELKRVVSDVRTFLLMFRGSKYLRHELVTFWRQLASGASSKDTYTPFDMSPTHYDPVETYDRTVQHWIAHENPSTVELHCVLKEILKLFDALSEYDLDLPPFLHTGLDLQHLSRLGIDWLGELNENRSSSRSSYYTKRWLWTQFPWIALGLAHRADSVAKLTKKGGEKGNGDQAVDPNDDDDNDDDDDDAGTLPHLREIETSFWDAKKTLPSLERVGGAKGNKISQTSVRLQNLDFNRNPSRKVDTTESSLQTLQLSHKISQMRAAHRINRSSRAGIPYSTPSLRTMRHNSRYPSAEAFALQKGSRIHHIFTGGVLSEMESRLGATEGGVHNDCVLRNIPTHLKLYPVTKAQERVAKTRRHLAKLRNQHDMLVNEAREKQEKLCRLVQSIADREKQDAFTRECVEDGESMMVELKQRQMLMKEALLQVQATESLYERILKFCEGHKHGDIKTVERILRTSKDNYLNALRKCKEVEYELKHIRTVEIPEITKEINLNDAMQSKILSKLEDKIEENGREMDEKIEVLTKRQKIVEKIARSCSEQEQRRKVANAQNAAVLDAAMQSKALLQEKKLQVLSDAFDEMKRACGLKDVTKIYSKYLVRDQEREHLMQQRKMCESRLRLVREQKAFLTKQMEAIRYGGRIVTSRRVRKIDDDCREAERELGRKTEKLKTTLSQLNNVQNGILQLARLVNINESTAKSPRRRERDWVRLVDSIKDRLNVLLRRGIPRDSASTNQEEKDPSVADEAKDEENEEDTNEGTNAEAKTEPRKEADSSDAEAREDERLLQDVRRKMKALGAGKSPEISDAPPPKREKLSGRTRPLEASGSN